MKIHEFRRRRTAASDADDFDEIDRLEQLWDEAVDRLHADYPGDLNELSDELYQAAVADKIEWK